MLRTRSVSVLVVGAGGAGLRAAIAAADAGVDVVVLSKRRRLDAHTVLAAGGVNAALGSRDPEDSPEWHFADTFDEGYALAHPRMVERLVDEAPDVVGELASWGCRFARTEDGSLDQRFFGAHRYRRTCYAGDWTGRAIVSTLAEQVELRRREGLVELLEDQYVSDLLVVEGVVVGVLAFDLVSGVQTVFYAPSVVLAGGGHTRLWRRSSSRRDENYGEAMALGFAAGVPLADMELVQFHPTGMTFPESVAGTLVTEAVRGEGGRLTNALGERFMFRYDPARGELSTRDRVALGAYREILEGRAGPNGGVFLDISHLPKEVILEKLPRMYRQMVEYQMLDISASKMEVAPTAHYSMGGLLVDGVETVVSGLFAAGECTSGLHGANRLGGNSLSETLVFGRLAGRLAAERALDVEALRRPRSLVEEASSRLSGLVGSGEFLTRVLQRELRDLLWECAGVARDAARLEEGLSRLKVLRVKAEDVDVRPDSEGWYDLAQLLDLRAGLVTAELTLRGALERTESRGCHFRTDFPDLDEGLSRSFVWSPSESGPSLSFRDVVPVPERFVSALAAEPFSSSGRLLE